MVRRSRRFRLRIQSGTFVAELVMNLHQGRQATPLVRIETFFFGLISSAPGFGRERTAVGRCGVGLTVYVA